MESCFGLKIKDLWGFLNLNLKIYSFCIEKYFIRYFLYTNWATFAPVKR